MAGFHLLKGICCWESEGASEMGTVQDMVAALVTFELLWQLEREEVYLDSEGTSLHYRTV